MPIIESSNGPTLDRVMVATDFKAAVAMTIGEDSNPKIHLCYALEKPASDLARTLEAELKCEDALRRLVPRGIYEHCATDAVELRDATPHILEQARRTTADLIVMGVRRSPHSFGALPERNRGSRDVSGRIPRHDNLHNIVSSTLQLSDCRQMIIKFVPALESKALEILPMGG